MATGLWWMPACSPHILDSRGFFPVLLIGAFTSDTCWSNSISAPENWHPSATCHQNQKEKRTPSVLKNSPPWYWPDLFYLEMWTILQKNMLERERLNLYSRDLVFPAVFSLGWVNLRQDLIRCYFWSEMTSSQEAPLASSCGEEYKISLRGYFSFRRDLYFAVLLHHGPKNVSFSFKKFPSCTSLEDVLEKR